MADRNGNGGRKGSDVAREREHSASDRARDERRTVADSRRHNNGRGERQGSESLRREREADDAERTAERESELSARHEERLVWDAELALQRAACEDAERAADDLRDRERSRGDDLRTLDRLIRSHLQTIDAELGGLLVAVPRGAFEQRLSEGVGAIRKSVERVRSLLIESHPAGANEPEGAGGSG